MNMSELKTPNLVIQKRRIKFDWSAYVMGILSGWISLLILYKLLNFIFPGV